VSLLAVDMGSSSCKAVVFAEDGRILAHRSQAYHARSPQRGWAELHPDDFWQAFASTTRGVAAEVFGDPVEAMAISSHGETFVPVDSQGRPVAPAILNMDSRAVSEAIWLDEKIGRSRLFEITGLATHAMYPLAKIIWLQRHRNNIVSGTNQFLALPSYLLSRMGLPPMVDFSLASRFLAFDIRRHSWSTEILSACSLAPKQFSEAVPAGTVAGRLSSVVAHDLGLPDGTVVAVGGHDQPSAALGCGVLSPGKVSASLGTYECLLAASDTPVTNEPALAANLNSYCHVVPNSFVTIAYFPSGIMVDWLLHILFPDDAAQNAAERCQLLEEGAPSGPTGLFITPHLLGTCNPDFNPFAAGMIYGIRPETNRYEIFKGILEGIACEFASMAEMLELAAGRYQDIYVTGGGTRSSLGLRLRASLSRRRLHLMQSSEATCLGGAILAGVAAGRYASLSEAVEHIIKPAETIGPDPQFETAYQHRLERYRLAYASLGPVRRAQAAACVLGGPRD
jgi:xylulokinase